MKKDNALEKYNRFTFPSRHRNKRKEELDYRQKEIERLKRQGVRNVYEKLAEERKQSGSFALPKSMRLALLVGVFFCLLLFQDTLLSLFTGEGVDKVSELAFYIVITLLLFGLSFLFVRFSR
jgi:hypothetical protein